MSGATLTSGELDDAFPSHTRELTAHCYKMVGSHSDAEDLVQETYLRARAGIDGFAGRSSLRTWLYRIATNVCLTALHPRERRVLPSGLGAPSDDPTAPLRQDPAVPWLEPLPNPGGPTASPRTESDPGEIVALRDSVRIALVAALQYLAPRQRAALLLREVLGWSATEIADALDVTEPAVKSLLQRGRHRLEELDVEFDEVEPVSDQTQHDLLTRYVAAFETCDVDALAAIISDDFSVEATPCRTWFQGKPVCLPFYRIEAFKTSDDWRLLPTWFNGQPAVALYRRHTLDEAGHDVAADAGVFTAIGVSVLTMSRDRITKAHDFIDPRWVAAVDLPPRIETVRFASDAAPADPPEHPEL